MSELTPAKTESPAQRWSAALFVSKPIPFAGMLPTMKEDAFSELFTSPLNSVELATVRRRVTAGYPLVERANRTALQKLHAGDAVAIEGAPGALPGAPWLAVLGGVALVTAAASPLGHATDGFSAGVARMVTGLSQMNWTSAVMVTISLLAVAVVVVFAVVILTMEVLLPALTDINWTSRARPSQFTLARYVKRTLIPNTSEGRQLKQALAAVDRIRGCSSETHDYLDDAALRLDVETEVVALVERYTELARVRAEVEALSAAGASEQVAVLWAGLEAVVAASQPRVEALVAFARHYEELEISLTQVQWASRATQPAETLLGLLASTAGDAHASGLASLTSAIDTDRLQLNQVRVTLVDDLMTLQCAVEPSLSSPSVPMPR